MRNAATVFALGVFETAHRASLEAAERKFFSPQRERWVKAMIDTSAAERRDIVSPLRGNGLLLLDPMAYAMG